MDLHLKHKSVFVAASSKGLGRAMALQYAREGALVTIASRNEEELRVAQADITAATGIRPLVQRMDVSSASDVQAAIAAAADAHGGIDVLVTNAGGPPSGSFEAFADEDWQSSFEVNLLSVVRLIREALPHLREASDGGRIVNIASTSIKQPTEGLILSSVFRAGVHALTRSLATELGPDGILVNTVSPGRIGTDRIVQLDRARADQLGIPVEQVQAAAVSQIPLGRIGTPEEFAAMAVFLGSFANTYVTGQSLLIDGGTVKSI
ncbi:SDR family oxidoreductase [Paenibacillus protaetiae]|uniref:SDR family oxidoreductase n=1 Tax=Paenibacillus protaetiae TaxID=2509456 RepID=A0A4P6EWL6_9BACL|nr:SDR family oxidoreductase [Paenibacillus protaetiae]QAY67116.1 SDR family oxidoreductase [Paenibacillus protaetiae]